MQFKDVDSEIQKQIMSQMIHGSPYGKIVINSEHKICGLNKTMCEESGYHATELYGEELNMLLVENYERHTKHLEMWFKHPVIMDLSVRKIKLQNGESKDVRIQLFPITVWKANTMIQTGVVDKPKVFGCAAIVFD